MPAHTLSLREVAVPLTHPERTPRPQGHCSRACTIALATIIPSVILILIFTIAFLVWGKPYLQRRRQQKAAQEAAKQKLGDEESGGSMSDVSSLGGDVHRLNEAASRAEEGGRKMASTREEGHEHDHVLAMIGARP